MDADQSIHSVWEERFRSLGVTLHHFANPDQLIESHRQGLKFDRYLVDYEFLAQSKNGLDLIEIEKVAARSVLVTSRHNEMDVRNRAQSLNVSVIPKALAALVPIDVKAKDVVRISSLIVLLDDDDLVHMMWESSARECDVELKAFKCWRDLEKWLWDNTHTPSVTFYVDVELGHGEPSGLEVAHKIAQLSRGPVYLATGHNPSEFTRHTFLAGVVGKAPPKEAWRS